MSPGPDRQLEVPCLPKDIHFNPYQRTSPVPKVEPRDDLLLPPGGPLLLLGESQDSAAAYSHATRVQQYAVSGPLELPLLPAMAQPHGTSLPSRIFNVNGTRGSLSIDPINEAMLEDREGMPTRAAWKEVVDAYIDHLHLSKRAKALIDYDTYSKIFRVLQEPDSRAVGTPQFRFWSRKMFKIVEEEEKLVVTSGGRPVAIKEHIYDILCISHFMCKHGGRDKTCKIVRDHYTWIPKELIANFVKACPSCKGKKIQITHSDADALRSSYSIESIETFGRPSVAGASLEMGAPVPMFPNSANLLLPCGSNPAPVDQYLAHSSDSEVFNSFSPQCHLRIALPVPHATSNSMSTLANSPFSASTSIISPSAHPGFQSHQLPPLMQFLSRDGNVVSSPNRFVYSDSAVRSSANGLLIDPSLHEPLPAVCSCAQLTCSACTSSQPSQELGVLYEPYGRALHLDLGQPSALVVSQQSSSSGFPPSYSNCSDTFEHRDENSLISASTATTGSELPTPSTTTHSFVPLLHENSPLPLPDAACGAVQAPFPHVKGCAPALRINTTGLSSACHTPPIYSPRPLKAGDPVNALMMALEKQKTAAQESESQEAGAYAYDYQSAKNKDLESQELHDRRQRASQQIEEDQAEISCETQGVEEHENFPKRL